MNSNLFARWSPLSPLSRREERAAATVSGESKPLIAMLAGKVGDSVYLHITPPEAARELQNICDRIACAHADDDVMGLLELSLRLAINSRGPMDQRVALIGSRLAKAYRESGDLDLSLMLQRDVLAVCEEIYEPHAEEVLTVKGMLGNTLLEKHDWTGALVCLEEALALAHRRPTIDPFLIAGLCNDLVATYVKLQQLGRAHQRADDALAAITGLVPRDEAEAASIFTICSNSAFVMFAAGDLSGSYRIETRLVEQMRSALGANHRLTLRALGNLAVTERHLRHPARSLEANRLSFEGTVATLGRDHPQTILLGSNLATALASQNRWAECVEVAAQVLRHAEAALAAGNDVVDHCANCIRLIADSGVDSTLQYEYCKTLTPIMPSLSKSLCNTLELRNSDSLDDSLRAFKMFHRSWAYLCMGYDVDNLLRALMPLHGLESWAASLRGVERDHVGVNEATRLTFLESREALRRLRQRLAAREATIEHAMSTPNSRGAPIDTEKAALMAQERVALEAYVASRRLLAESDAGFQGLELPRQSTVAQLIARLAMDEIVVFTVAFSDQSELGIVVCATGLYGVVKFGNLHALEQLRVEYSNGLRSFDGSVRFRDYQGVTGSLPVVAVSLAELQEKVAASFWAPLGEWLVDRDQLKRAVRLYVVTGPGHHSLPLEAARPSGVEAYYYSGMPAFFAHRERVPVSRSVLRTEVVIDAAWETPAPIPFVEMEARLIESLRGSQGVVVRRTAQQLLAYPVASRLMLSCHGTIVGTGTSRHGVLVLDSAAGITLDAAAVSHMQGRLTEVWMSACVGGVVAATQAGDALGVVGELQNCGVSTVVGCLAPVHDFYMPLLTALYLYHTQDDVPPAVSLQRAKRLLLQRSWPVALDNLLKASYADQMHCVLIQSAYVRGGRGDIGQDNTTASALRARRAMSTVSGWPLPGAVRRSYFLDETQTSTSVHEAFSRNFCESPHRRGLLISGCLEAVFARHSSLLADRDVQMTIDEALAHLCAFTVCYGGSHPQQSVHA